MPDRERYFDQSRDERDARRRGRDYEARLDDRTGVSPGSPGGYLAAPSRDPRYTEARSFEPGKSYHSEFAEGHPAHRPEHEINDAEYRRRREYYRGADFSGGEQPHGGGYEARPGEPGYNDFRYPDFSPYEAGWGIGPNFGFGHDLYGRSGAERAPPAPPRMRSGQRHFWNKASDEVASWMGDEAAHIRREIDRGEFAGRGPKGYKRSDERIKEEVSDRMTNDSWLDASHIEVEVKEGEVTLNGHVASRDDKKRAELWAESISGVDHVQNNLRVDRNLSGEKPGSGAGPDIAGRQPRGSA